jgi:hypothetical protein
MAIQKSHMPSTETKTTYIAVNDHIRDVPGQIFARAQQPLDLRQMLAGVRGSSNDIFRHIQFARAVTDIKTEPQRLGSQTRRAASKRRF